MNIYSVKGNSMSPTLKEGDLLVIKKPKSQKIFFRRNDIIVLKNPKDPTNYFIKRVIGLPKEKNKSFLSLKTIETLPDNINTYNELSENEYFVIGDNYFHSTDSRHFGPIKKSMIIGKVFLRIWPLYRLRYWF